MLEDLHRAFEQDFPRWVEENARPFVLPETSQATIEWVKAMALGTSLKAVLDCHRMLVREDFRAELKAIDLPVLVIQGDADISSPIDLAGRPTAELIPGARLEIYEGAPHGLFITHRERLNRDLAEPPPGEARREESRQWEKAPANHRPFHARRAPPVGELLRQWRRSGVSVNWTLPARPTSRPGMSVSWKPEGPCRAAPW